MIIATILAILFLQGSKQDKPAENTKESLRKLIVDFDKTYRRCAGRYNSAKTTADQQDIANENFADLNEWVRTNNETPIDFECLFVDIFRSEEDGYAGNFTIPKQLQLFVPPSRKPLLCKPIISLPVEPELRDLLERGMKVYVKAELRAEPLRERKHDRQIEQQSLFHLLIQHPLFQQANQPDDYTTHFTLHDITITPDADDLKKAAKKKSK